MLPHASVARHVRVATNVFGHVVFVTVPTTTTVTAPHVSLAVGAVKFHAAPASTVTSDAHTIPGAVLSTTVTAWLHWAALPHASAACQVRTAVNVLPQAALVTVPTTPIVPPGALGASNVHAAPHSTVLSGAQVIAGGVVSPWLTR